MREKGAEVEERNYAKSGLAEADVKALVAAAGGVEPLLNKRHETAKKKGWAERPPSAAEFAAAVAKDANLLRRPVLVAGRRVVVGFDREAYEKL